MLQTCFTLQSLEMPFKARNKNAGHLWNRPLSVDLLTNRIKPFVAMAIRSAMASFPCAVPISEEIPLQLRSTMSFIPSMHQSNGMAQTV
jgi:hypothetical protein